MTSVSFNSQVTRSPLTMLQRTLASDVSTGKIKSSDQSTLNSALESLGSALQSSSPVSPEAGKAKVESLVDSLVSKGTLTSEQGSQLKSVFDETMAGGPGAPQGKMEPPPPPRGEGPGESQSSGGIDQIISSSNSNLSELLQELMESLASDGGRTYSSTGTTSSGISSLFIDKSA